MEIKQFKNIETFLFDLGGVIIDIDSKRTIDGFVKLGFKGIGDHITQSHHEGLFKQLERGEIDEDTFINKVKALIDTPVETNEITSAWNQMVGSIPAERAEIIEKLKAEFPVYLLSNTNGIHLRHCDEMTEGQTIKELFNEVFYSYQLGCSKPEASAFQKVIDQTGLKPETTLFLDDSQVNLDAAKALGFQTKLITEEEDMISFFTQKKEA